MHVNVNQVPFFGYAEAYRMDLFLKRIHPICTIVREISYISLIQEKAMDSEIFCIEFPERPCLLNVKGSTYQAFLLCAPMWIYCTMF